MRDIEHPPITYQSIEAGIARERETIARANERLERWLGLQAVFLANEGMTIQQTELSMEADLPQKEVL